MDPAVQAFVDEKLADANHIDVSDAAGAAKEAKEHLGDLASRYACPACTSDDQYHAIFQSWLEALVWSCRVWRGSNFEAGCECVHHQGI